MPVATGRSLVAIALSIASAQALALQGDRIRPYVGAQFNYNTNVFYVDDRRPASDFPFLRNGQLDDYSYGLQAGLDVNIPVSRQLFKLDADVTRNNYSTYKELDYTGYNVRGVWNWAYADKWDGDAGAVFNQALGSFADFFGANRAINLLKRQEYFASGMYRLTYDWKLRAGIRHSIIDNSAASLNQLNQRNTTYEAGTRYYSKGGDNFLGLSFLYTDGRFPNRELVAGTTLTRDNSFEQYELMGNADWRYSDTTKFVGRLGWTVRRFPNVPKRDFAGPTGRLTGIYNLSARTSLTAAAFQEIGLWEDLTSSYIVTTGFTLGANYSLSEKTLLQLSYDARRRDFQGNPGFVILDVPSRKDDIQTLSASATWLPLRNVTIRGSLSYATRSANIPLTDFAATILSVSGQLAF
jgi:exopolysaccharide biosynthesis operon protein EpsL